MSVHSSCGGQIDADLRIGDGRLVIQPVADDVDAEAEFVDQGIVEHVSFGDAAEAAMQGNIEREVQIVGTGLAAGLNAVRIGAEGLKRVGIGPEEALGKTVFPAAKFAVPVQR